MKHHSWIVLKEKIGRRTWKCDTCGVCIDSDLKPSAGKYASYPRDYDSFIIVNNLDATGCDFGYQSEINADCDSMICEMVLES